MEFSALFVLLGLGSYYYLVDLGVAGHWAALLAISLIVLIALAIIGVHALWDMWETRRDNSIPYKEPSKPIYDPETGACSHGIPESPYYKKNTDEVS